MNPIGYDHDEPHTHAQLPSKDINLLQLDWANVSAWYLLLDGALENPCRFVLSKGTYRDADPPKLAKSLAARNTLLTAVASSAISGMGRRHLLEGKGLWPTADTSAKSVTQVLSEIAEKCIELINAFLVEDEESLKCLLCACERESINASELHGKCGQAARTRIAQALGLAECLLLAEFSRAG